MKIADWIDIIWHYVQYFYTFVLHHLPYSLLLVAVLFFLFYRAWILLRLYLRCINPFRGMITKVVRVADGDTIIVGNPRSKNAKRRYKVRLIGIDTPESVRSLYQDVMPFGKEASDYTKSRLRTGTRVFLVFDKESRDKFGRLLAYIYLSNGEFLNATLVKKGYAFAKRFPPNTRYASLFDKLENQAQRQQRGLWKIYSSYGELKDRYKRVYGYYGNKKSYY
jgi:micrococcal nuclease